jgi:hypothetical protein
MAASCACEQQVLRHGQRGEITFNACEKRPAAGRVSEIRPEPGQQQRTLAVV